MEKLSLELEYEWEPFTVGGQHLTFTELAERKLFPNECSHWGAAVFKWEGPLTKGELGANAFKIGMFIDETDNLSGYIQQLAAATGQSSGLFGKKVFLLSGELRLYVLKLLKANIGETDPTLAFESWFYYTPRERRIAYKQLLTANQGLKRLPHIVLLP